MVAPIRTGRFNRLVGRKRQDRRRAGRGTRRAGPGTRRAGRNGHDSRGAAVRRALRAAEQRCCHTRARQHDNGCGSDDYCPGKEPAYLFGRLLSPFRHLLFPLGRLLLPVCSVCPGVPAHASPRARPAPGGPSGGRARERAARRERPSGRKGPGVSSARVPTAPGDGRLGQVGRDAIIQRALLKGGNEARQAVPGDARVRAAPGPVASNTAKSQVIATGRRVNPGRACAHRRGITEPAVRSRGNRTSPPRWPPGRVRVAVLAGTERNRLPWPRLLAGPRLLASSASACRAAAQASRDRLRADRPSRRSLKKRPPGRRVQISAERPAVHIPAVAVHRPGQPDVQPGRQRGPRTRPADGRGARSVPAGWRGAGLGAAT